MSKRILVVEDQPDNRQIIRDMLAGTDYGSQPDARLRSVDPDQCSRAEKTQRMRSVVNHLNQLFLRRAQTAYGG
jgi:CheY-like chemotaxis protein